MRAATKFIILAVMGLSFTGIGTMYQSEARATTAIKAQQANPMITITVQSGSPAYVYDPAQINAKVGQSITITNNDPNGLHSVTAKDRSFSVDVPPKGSATLTVPKAGSYPYHCTYHPDEHNAASINVS